MYVDMHANMFRIGLVMRLMIIRIYIHFVTIIASHRFLYTFHFHCHSPKMASSVTTQNSWHST